MRSESEPEDAGAMSGEAASGEAASGEASPVGGAHRRVALLVIHGIGQQRPLQPLDNLVRGFVRRRLLGERRPRASGDAAGGAAVPSDRLASLAPAPRVRRLADRSAPYLRIDGAGLGLPDADLDVHEFFWADRMRGRIRAWPAFAFLLRSGLAGLNFRQQLPMLLARDAHRGRDGGRARIAALFTVLREVGIAAVLLLGVALLATLPLIFGMQLVVAGLRSDIYIEGGRLFDNLVGSLDNPPAFVLFLFGAIAGSADVLQQALAILTLPLRAALLIDSPWAFVRHTIEIVLFGVVVVLGGYLLTHIVGGWLTMLRIRLRHLRLGDPARPPYSGTSVPPRAARPPGWADWRGLAFVTLAGVALVAAWLGWRVRADLTALIDALLLLGRALWRQGALLIAPLLIVLIAWGARRILIDFVGDIALYVTTDPHSPHVVTRREIQSACADALGDLLAEAGNRQGSDGEGGYDAVFVAGHSLGSVIAYDALNTLEQRRRNGTGGLGATDLARLRGLLTFGSPLDKIYYFYRRLAREGEAIRGQLLSYSDATRKRSSHRYYGPYRLARYDSGFDELLWVNVYALADPVSGYLDHYRIDPEHQHALPYINPFTAHNAYWDDARFTDIVLEWLREGLERSASERS